MRSDDPAPARTTRTRRMRHAITWIVTIALLAWVLHAVPLARMWQATIAAGLASVVALTLAYFLYSYVVDAVATWGTFAWFCAKLRPGDVFAIRGATYLLAMLNYNLGQGGIVFLVGRKPGVGLARATGTVLLTMGVMLVALLMLAFSGSMLSTVDDPRLKLMRWISGGGLVAFILYLVVIRLRPAFIANREVLTPLFDAGLIGHLKAWLIRLPHVVGHIVFQWALLNVFGIRIPFLAAAALLPVQFVIGWIPITIQGLGTQQVAAMELLSRYGTAATLDGRHAQVVAFSLSLSSLFTVYSILIGVLCLQTQVAREARGSKKPRTSDT
jgi:hypothetical protein